LPNIPRKLKTFGNLVWVMGYAAKCPALPFPSRIKGGGGHFMAAKCCKEIQKSF